VSIGTLREDLVDMVTEGDGVMLFTYQRELARFSLSRIGRDGTPATVIGRHKGLGDPKSPVLGEDATYFIRNKTLYRMPRDGGETTQLAKAFSNAIAVKGNSIYGVSCDPKNPIDHLVRIATSGGEVESLVDIERPKAQDQDGGTFPCDYRSLAADDGAVYLAHWNGRRVLRVSLADKTVTALATKRAFPSHLGIEGESILFQAADGLYRVSKTGPDATRVTELGSSPFTMVVYSGPVLFIHQSEPYQTEEWTYEVPLAGGKPKKLEFYKALEPVDTPPDVGVRGIAADDECIYTVRQLKNAQALYARRRATSP
jgi:hypothetical protein